MALIQSLVESLTSAVIKGLSGLPFAGGMTTYFLHTFTGPDGTTIPAPDIGSAMVASQTGTGAVWGISAERLTLSTFGTGTAFYDLDEGRADGEFSFTVADNIDHTVGVRFRASDTTNYIYLSWPVGSPGAITLAKMVAGASTTLGDTGSIVLGVGDVIRVVLSGFSIQVYVNDVLRLSVSESFNATATKHGAWQTSASKSFKWDNMKFAA